jgi:hypothetical protein
MTILTEVERKAAILYYGYGWSFQEITKQLLENRSQKIYYDMAREVAVVGP